jgi:hypothetical protein
VQRGTSHGHGPFLGKAERSVALCHAFVCLIAACGDYTTAIPGSILRRHFPGVREQMIARALPIAETRDKEDDIHVAIMLRPGADPLNAPSAQIQISGRDRCLRVTVRTHTQPSDRAELLAPLIGERRHPE